MKRKHSAVEPAPVVVHQPSPQFIADVVLADAADQAIEMNAMTNANEVTRSILESIMHALDENAYSAQAKLHLQGMLSWPKHLSVATVTRIFAPPSVHDRAPSVERWLTMLITEISVPTQLEFATENNLLDAMCAVANAGNEPLFHVFLARLPSSISWCELFMRAAKFGAMRVIRWMSETGRLSSLDFFDVRTAFQLAAAYGHVPVLQWCKENFDHITSLPNIFTLCLQQALTHNRELAARWFDEAYNFPMFSIMLDEVCRGLCRNNEINGVKMFLHVFENKIYLPELGNWMFREGCFLDNTALIKLAETDLLCTPTNSMLQRAVWTAANRGSISVLDYVWDKYRQWFFLNLKCLDRAFCEASVHARIGSLKWLKARYRVTRNATGLIDGFQSAAMNGKLVVLQWYKENYGDILNPYKLHSAVSAVPRQYVRDWVEMNFPRRKQ